MPHKKATWTLLTMHDLTAYRQRRGFKSDAALAEDLEVSVGSISGWKKGVRAPSLRVQQQLANKLRSAQPRTSGARNTDTEQLVKRLLSLAAEVEDASVLIEASKRLLEADLQE